MAERKRTNDQILADRKRIAELKLQRYTDKEIAKKLKKETGLALSRRQINYDLGIIRKNWMNGSRQTYDTYVTIELARLDALENSIWDAMRGSATGKKKTVIEKTMEELNSAMSDEEREAIISKVIETTETVAINPAYFAQIQEAQKERRRLLGLYAPQQLNINKTVVTKGYIDVSPNDWPDVIEGELVD